MERWGWAGRNRLGGPGLAQFIRKYPMRAAIRVLAVTEE